MFIKRSLKTTIIFVFVFVLVAASYAFAAANTLPANTYAGDGNVTISGITVTNVRYTVTVTASPATTIITGVTLTLGTAAPATTLIRVKLLTAGAWYDCSNSGTTTVTCDTSAAAVTVTAADNLRVVAYDNAP
jgi:hypothetical protein